MCNNCEYPERKLWAVGPPYPKWETPLQSANFVSLVMCPDCKQHWVEVPYESYASFRYAVPWLFSGSIFTALMNKDAGLTLSRWHEAEVRFLANLADQQTLSYIKAHYDRSRGLVNLMPTDQPNTIPIES